MARRRRRRPDGSENFEETEEDEDLDIRVTSVEEEIQNLAVSTLSQTQQMTALRAKLDKLARELEEGNDGDDELFQELDGLKTSLHSFQSQFSEAQAQLTNRFAQQQHRLDQIGEHGPLEELPVRLRRDVAAMEARVEDRLRSFEQAREEEGDLLLSRLEEFNQNIDESVAAIRTNVQTKLQEVFDQVGEVRRSAASQEALDRFLEDVDSRFETFAQDVQRSLQDVDASLQGAAEEQAKAQQLARENVTAAIDELAGLVDERASQEDVARLKAQFAELNSKLEALGGLEERSRAAASEVQRLESQLREQGERYKSLLEQGKNSLDEVEKHQDKVSIAIKLVDALSDRARGGGAPGSNFSGASISEKDLEAPEKTELGFELKDLIGVMVTHQATDLHLKVDSPPTVRLRGELIPVGNHILGEEDCRRLIFSTLTKEQRRTLLEQKHFELICDIHGARMRALVFVQRGRLSASFKVLHRSLPSFEELGLPSALKKLVSTLGSGLLLVGGPTGSGKSTTLAALVELLNSTRKIHIVTLEKPIEHVHADLQSLVTQREIGTDSASFSAGLREAMRMDPDVIMVENLEDSETLALALGAAESGHLILAGVDALTAVQAVDLLTEGLNRSATRAQVAACLRGVVCQKLLPRADRKGFVVSTEVLLNNSSVSQCIAEGQSDKINALLSRGGEGLQSFAHSLQKLADAGLISSEGGGSAYEAPPAAPAQASAPITQYQASPPPIHPDPETQPSPGGDDTIMGWL